MMLKNILRYSAFGIATLAISSVAVASISFNLFYIFSNFTFDYFLLNICLDVLNFSSLYFNIYYGVLIFTDLSQFITDIKNFTERFVEKYIYQDINDFEIIEESLPSVFENQFISYKDKIIVEFLNSDKFLEFINSQAEDVFNVAGCNNYEINKEESIKEIRKHIAKKIEEEIYHLFIVKNSNLLVRKLDSELFSHTTCCWLVPKAVSSESMFIKFHHFNLIECILKSENLDITQKLMNLSDINKLLGYSEDKRQYTYDEIIDNNNTGNKTNFHRKLKVCFNKFSIENHPDRNPGNKKCLSNFVKYKQRFSKVIDEFKPKISINL